MAVVIIVTGPPKRERKVEPQEDGSANIVETDGTIVATFTSVKDAIRYLKHLDP